MKPFGRMLSFALMNCLRGIPVWLIYFGTANRHLEDLAILFTSDSPLAYKAESELSDKKRALRFSADTSEAYRLRVRPVDPLKRLPSRRRVQRADLIRVRFHCRLWVSVFPYRSAIQGLYKI